jgi:hypothetical protein
MKFCDGVLTGPAQFTLPPGYFFAPEMSPDNRPWIIGIGPVGMGRIRRQPDEVTGRGTLNASASRPQPTGAAEADD